MLAQARRHVGLVLGSPASYVSSIHMADATAAVAAALQEGEELPPVDR
jgi:NAD dependent epimerase/dehydratase family enzyme